MEVYGFPPVDPRKTCVSVAFFCLALLTDSDFRSGLREKRYLVSYSSPPSCRNLFSSSSSVIQDIMTVCEAGSAIMAYFYFDFRDLKKQNCHDLLLSLVSQLSTRSSPCCDILHRITRHTKVALDSRVMTL
jgi:hypothetical protein